jgi:energy-coupling factor transport system substrate-specific component
VSVEGLGPDDGARASQWDPFVEELRAFRARVGSPSFRELAERVAAARVERGMDPFNARVGRTTVFDCFQTGRPRYNLRLAREVGAALGADEETLESWVRACQPGSDDAVDVPVQAAAQATGATAVGAAGLPLATALRVALLGLALSLLGRGVVVFLDLPLHLDMIGTALAAFVLGPWWAVGVGVATNLTGVAISGPSSIPFALVQVAGGLAWGYGVRRWRTGERIIRFTGLTVAVAFLCSVVATPIIMTATTWEPRAAFEPATDAFLTFWGVEAVALFLGNLVISVLDKLLSAFVALVAVASLAPPVRARFPLADRLSPLD